MEFRFEVYDRVKVINAGEQYSTHWEAYGKLMHGCVVGAWGNSFIVGAHLNDENLENTVFQIIARDRIDTACGEKNLYLITSQSDYDAINSRKVDEKGEPAKIYVISEDGLEVYEEEVDVFCIFSTSSGNIEIVEGVSRKDFDAVKEFEELNRGSYAVNVKARSSCDAKEQAKKLFTEYFSKLWDKRSAETKKELQEISDNLYKVQHWNG